MCMTILRIEIIFIKIWDIRIESQIFGDTQEYVLCNFLIHLIGDPELRNNEVEPPSSAEHQCQALLVVLSFGVDNI